jgi:hypothetical protein
MWHPLSLLRSTVNGRNYVVIVLPEIEAKRDE